MSSIVDHFFVARVCTQQSRRYAHVHAWAHRRYALGVNLKVGAKLARPGNLRHYISTGCYDILAKAIKLN